MPVCHHVCGLSQCHSANVPNERYVIMCSRAFVEAGFNHESVKDPQFLLAVVATELNAKAIGCIIRKLGPCAEQFWVLTAAAQLELRGPLRHKQDPFCLVPAFDERLDFGTRIEMLEEWFSRPTSRLSNFGKKVRKMFPDSESMLLSPAATDAFQAQFCFYCFANLHIGVSSVNVSGSTFIHSGATLGSVIWHDSRKFRDCLRCSIHDR